MKILATTKKNPIRRHPRICGGSYASLQTRGRCGFLMALPADSMIGIVPNQFGFRLTMIRKPSDQWEEK